MAERERITERTNGTFSPARQWAEYLLAVLIGNILYLLLEPELPGNMRHRMFRVDVGLAIDFAICVAVYGLIRLARPYTYGRN